MKNVIYKNQHAIAGSMYEFELKGFIEKSDKVLFKSMIPMIRMADGRTFEISGKLFNRLEKVEFDGNHWLRTENKNV